MYIDQYVINEKSDKITFRYIVGILLFIPTLFFFCFSIFYVTRNSFFINPPVNIQDDDIDKDRIFMATGLLTVGVLSLIFIFDYLFNKFYRKNNKNITD